MIVHGDLIRKAATRYAIVSSLFLRAIGDLKRAMGIIATS
jgi:hypothetical protein